VGRELETDPKYVEATVKTCNDKLGATVPSMATVRQEWFSNIRGGVLAGIVVAPALMPEAIAFSIIAWTPRWGCMPPSASRR
jgi:hypothetical protein